MCGITIGARALIGAGAVVTHDVKEAQSLPGFRHAFSRAEISYGIFG